MPHTHTVRVQRNFLCRDTRARGIERVYIQGETLYKNKLWIKVTKRNRINISNQCPQCFQNIQSDQPNHWQGKRKDKNKKEIQDGSHASPAGLQTAAGYYLVAGKSKMGKEYRRRSHCGLNCCEAGGTAFWADGAQDSTRMRGDSLCVYITDAWTQPKLGENVHHDTIRIISAVYFHPD